jgi:hypothetical protein
MWRWLRPWSEHGHKGPYRFSVCGAVLSIARTREAGTVPERGTTLRKLWVKAWLTLDGVFDADTMGHWWQNTNSPERMQYITEQYANGDAYLLGRATYEMLWPGWSQQTTGDGPGPLLNRMHKYVVSTTLSEAPWEESTIISENVVERSPN